MVALFSFFNFSLLLFAAAIIVPLFNIIYWKLFGLSEKKKIKIIGHRGSAGLAPENTIAAIDEGLHHNVDFVEIDIRQTKDKKIVVIHDKTVNRTTNGKGYVHKLFYSDIEILNASTYFPGYPRATKVPLLSEVLIKLKKINTNCKVLIEIKSPFLYPGLASRLLDIVRENKMDNEVILFSFNKKILTTIKQKAPSIRTGIFSLGFIKVNKALGVTYIAPNWLTILYFPYYSTLLKNRGFKVFVWTIDSSFFIGYLLSKNIDGIITNCPNKARIGPA